MSTEEWGNKTHTSSETLVGKVGEATICLQYADNVAEPGWQMLS